MEEITIRFEIVRLAVKMADHETIGVQAKKLRELSLDEDLNEIIGLLESRNYRQGLYLMKGYMSSLDDSFFEPTPAPVKAKKPEPQPESQNLFDMMQPKSSQTINLDDMLRMTEESASETISYEKSKKVSESYISQAKEEVEKNEAYLDMHKHRVENKTKLPPKETVEELLYNPLEERVEENIVDEDPIVSLDIAEEAAPEIPIVDELEVADIPEPDRFILEPEEVPKEAPDLVHKEQDVMEEPIPEEIFVEEGSTEEELAEEEPIKETIAEEVLEVTEVVSENIEIDDGTSDTLLQEDDPKDDPAPKIIPAEEAVVNEINISIEKPEPKEIPLDNELPVVEEEGTEPKSKADHEKDHRKYPPISYIDQKFRNMRHQFPQVEAIGDISDDVKLLLKQMATKGYTENDIKETIAEFQKKKSAGENAEAAQLLLVAAASESKYAQLLLARELFKGEVLVADYPESFTQINRLAEHDYPEAICDLAQLYEYGYGIKKDKKTAILLYQEAAEMGIPRAQKHVERLTSKKGLLGSLFKR